MVENKSDAAEILEIEEEEDEDITYCDFCDKPAKFNIQLRKTYYSNFYHIENGNYIKDQEYCNDWIEEPTGEDNKHYCKECLLEEEGIEL